MHRTIDRDRIPAALAQAALEELRYGAFMHAPRFAATSCSQCGKDLGPADSGVSRCTDHWLASIVKPYGGQRPVFPAGLPNRDEVAE